MAKLLGRVGAIFKSGSFFGALGKSLLPYDLLNFGPVSRGYNCHKG
jgi:hypothetical protein